MRRSAFAKVSSKSLLLGGLVTIAGCAGYIHEAPWSPPTFSEREPNDSPWAPDYLGGVDIFSHFIVEGFVEAVGFDTVDHFEICADEPVGIEFSLYGYDAYADLDLHLFDPDSGLIVASYDGPWNPEEGFFTIDYPGKRVVLVVEAWLTDSHYSLEIRATPNPFYGDAPNDGPAAASLSLDEDLAEGSGISFPDGLPTPNAGKQGVDALDEEAAVFLLRNSARREGF